MEFFFNVSTNTVLEIVVLLVNGNSVLGATGAVLLLIGEVLLAIEEVFVSITVVCLVSLL
jgi:hypothetical protein